MSGIVSTIGKVLGKVPDLIDELHTTDEERLAAQIDQYKAETERLALTADERKAEIDLEKATRQGQIDINKEEARSSSLLVAGWRPIIGWICGAALAWHFVIAELLQWIFVMAGGEATFPELSDTQDLFFLLTGILGLGGMRSFEKSKGLADRKMPSLRRRK